MGVYSVYINVVKSPPLWTEKQHHHHNHHSHHSQCNSCLYHSATSYQASQKSNHILITQITQRNHQPTTCRPPSPTLNSLPLAWSLLATQEMDHLSSPRTRSFLNSIHSGPRPLASAPSITAPRCRYPTSPQCLSLPTPFHAALLEESTSVSQTSFPTAARQCTVRLPPITQ